MLVNGKEMTVPENSTLLDLIRHYGLNPEAVAVERNGQIEKRDSYADIKPGPDDKIELIRFVGGG